MDKAVLRAGGSPSPIVLAVLGALALAATALGLAALLGGGTLGLTAIEAFVLAFAAHAIVYAAAVWLILERRSHAGGLALIVAVAVLMRLVALGAPPALTSDAYRYVWDGRVQAAGINPYLYVPADQRLAHLRDQTIWPNINRADTHPTIYPPVAEMLFLVATRIVDGIRGVQILMLVLDLVSIWAIWRWLAAAGMPLERVLIYAWHPLPLWEFAGMGHIDAAAVAFTCLALLAAERGRQGWSGAALAAAGLVKYNYLLLAPALWRRWRWTMPLAMAATVALAYLPYLSAGPQLLGSLFTHLGEEGYADGYGFYLVGFPRHMHWPYPDPLVFAACAGLALLALGAWIVLRPDPDRLEPWHPIILCTAFLVLVSPHYPWYYAVAIPLLCRQLYLPLLWMTLVVAGVYLERPDGLLEPYTRIKVFTTMFAGFALLALAHLAWRRATEFRRLERSV